MIVPGFLVNRIYRKGSLRREEGGTYSFAFKNTIAGGTATLLSPERIAVKSPVGEIELTTFPELYVNGSPILKEDAMMVIGGQVIPHYDPEAARARVGESLAFHKGDEIVIRIRGDLRDGRHTFRAVFHSRQFGEVVLNFSDRLGELERAAARRRLAAWLAGIFRRPATGPGPQVPDGVRETRLYLLEGRRPDPDFGRLAAALARRQPDRVPLIELMVDEEVKTAFLGRPITSMRDEVEFWLAAGYDYVPLWVLNITPRKVVVIDSHQTSYKQGLQERAWVDETSGTIVTEEDFRACEWPELDDSLFGAFEEIGGCLPREMQAIGCVNGVFETVTQAMGLETFCVNLYERPALVEAMFERAGDLIHRCIERLLGYERVGAVWVTDDLAYKQGPIISPKMLRTYVFPWFRRFVDLVHARGLPILLHSCGNVEPLLEDIVAAGFDALHPLEANSIDIRAVKRKVGDRICLCGNLDLSYMLTRAPVEEIAEDVKTHLRDLAPGGGYCLGSGNSIPNYVPLDKYLAMNRACLEYGRYPIRLQAPVEQGPSAALRSS
jgi:uroporphyrinogen decarboxylase